MRQREKKLRKEVGFHGQDAAQASQGAPSHFMRTRLRDVFIQKPGGRTPELQRLPWQREDFSSNIASVLLLTHVRIWKHINNHHLTCILLPLNIIIMERNDENTPIDESLLTPPSRPELENKPGPNKRQADASPSLRGKKRRAKGRKSRASEAKPDDKTAQGVAEQAPGSRQPGDALQWSVTLPSRPKSRKPSTAGKQRAGEKSPGHTKPKQQPTATATTSGSASASAPAHCEADQPLPPPFTPIQSRRSARRRRKKEKQNRKNASQQAEPEEPQTPREEPQTPGKEPQALKEEPQDPEKEPQNPGAVGEDLALVQSPRSEASWSLSESEVDKPTVSFH